MQENPREKTLASYHGELTSFCHGRHAGQANTCKGVSPRNRNELERIRRNASPRGLQMHESVSWVNACSMQAILFAFIGQNSEPQTAPAINRASAGEMLWGAAGTRPHPDHSLKLQSFKTVSSAKELPSPFRPTKFSSYKVNRAVSEGKWPLTMDNESLDFSQVDGSKLCFLCS